MIDVWLSRFKDAWIAHDIDAVMALFADDVEYWETPFRRLDGKDEVRAEWEVVKRQSDIRLETSVYSTNDSEHSVVWHLRYLDEDQVEQTWGGAYLITLDAKGVCTYFFHAGEKA